jgi:hypothetical protein
MRIRNEGEGERGKWQKVKWNREKEGGDGKGEKGKDRKEEGKERRRSTICFEHYGTLTVQNSSQYVRNITSSFNVIQYSSSCSELLQLPSKYSSICTEYSPNTSSVVPGLNVSSEFNFLLFQKYKSLLAAAAFTDSR